MGGRSPDAADLKSIARSLQPLRLAAGIAVQRAAPTRRKYARHASAEAGGPTARVPRQRALNSSFRRPSAPLSSSRAAGAKPSRGTTSPCRRRHRLAALALAHSALRRADLVHRVLAAHGPAVPSSASRSRLVETRSNLVGCQSIVTPRGRARPAAYVSAADEYLTMFRAIAALQ